MSCGGFNVLGGLRENNSIGGNQATIAATITSNLVVYHFLYLYFLSSRGNNSLTDMAMSPDGARKACIGRPVVFMAGILVP